LRKSESRTNKAKHGVSFEEARTAFLDENARIMPDEAHSTEEDRFVLLGLSEQTEGLALDTETTPALPTIEPIANPHVLWRQLLGFVLWVGVLSFAVGSLVGMVLCLTLGGLAFADAWKSGIYKHPDRKSFLNISPMGWGIAMALLFVFAFPAYVFNRNKLRTVRGSNALFGALIVVGTLVIALVIYEIDLISTHHVERPD
jgi:hypothetical protein